jgi:phosphoglycolate phosphatase-like HAD superfamily hydrolase
MGVVSNKKSAILNDEINFIGWQSYFDTIIGSGDAPADKPSPEPLNLALKRMALVPSLTIWFIGDSPVDWACAQQSGCRPFSIHNPSTDPSIFHVTHFHHLEEIIDLKHNPCLPA